MRPYNPYANYIPGYNPCMEAAGYSAYSMPGAGSGEAVQPLPLPTPVAPMPKMPNMPSYPGTPGMPDQTTVCPTGAVPYIVQEGDTLYAISRMYGATVAEILAANPSITQTSMLFIGQVVCVPIPAPCRGQKYTVMPGETFYSISRRFGLTVAELMAANPGIPADRLMAGVVICVPTPTMRPCPAGSMTYTVAPGDTLTSIADRFSLSVYSLSIANPGFSAENLTPGMRLCIAPFACQPSCVESERYTILEGEDLTKVAEKFKVNTDDLLKANPFSPPCQFTPGIAICLPANATMPTPTAQHSRH